MIKFEIQLTNTLIFLIKVSLLITMHSNLVIFMRLSKENFYTSIMTNFSVLFLLCLELNCRNYTQAYIIIFRNLTCLYHYCQKWEHKVLMGLVTKQWFKICSRNKKFLAYNITHARPVLLYFITTKIIFRVSLLWTRT